MEGPCRNAQNYFDQLYQFHFQQGIPFQEPPCVEGSKIDFYLLKKLANEFNYVCIDEFECKLIIYFVGLDCSYSRTWTFYKCRVSCRISF